MQATANNQKRGWWWAAVMLAMVGMGVAIELTRIHLRLQAEPTHQSFCNLSATVNCDAVAKSSYAVMLGLPLSVWGTFAYLMAIVIAVWGLRSDGRAASAMLWILGATCTLSAVALALVAAFILRSWCLLCMVTWGIDLGLLVVGSVVVRESGLRAATVDCFDWCRDNAGRCGGWALALVVLIGAAYRFFPHSGDVLSKSANAALLTHAAPLSSNKLNEGVDENGQPYVGARLPKLVITEFSDYQCPHCARAHEQLRSMVAHYPEAIRVIHRHFPLDNDCNPKIPRPFHLHACYYARLAVCAAALGKFWQGNDYLFAHGRGDASIAIGAFAHAIDTSTDKLSACLANQADAILKRDLEAGAKLGIDGTPTFIIRGEKFTGELPEQVLQEYPL